jgi:hypothetical protein
MASAFSSGETPPNYLNRNDNAVGAVLPDGPSYLGPNAWIAFFQSIVAPLARRTMIFPLASL